MLKAYDADIRKITWMSDVTKAEGARQAAHVHAAYRLSRQVARLFRASSIKRDDLIGDVERASVFEWQYRLNRIDQPVDRNEWNMTPPTVNAYYTPVVQLDLLPGRDPAAAVLRSRTPTTR